MQTVLRLLRYIVFSLFIICNAVVASVAVWSHSLAPPSFGSSLQIDVYLIFLGCLGLVHIFSLIFIELAYRHAITGRVWFECAWTGLFWMLYLAAAAATTAISPEPLCKVQRSISINDLCVSARLLLAFTWITTITLLSYFTFLVTSSLYYLKRDPRIWNSYVHKFPWGNYRRSRPSSTLAAPAFPRFLKKMPSIVAPKPQRPAPALHPHHFGLGSEYEVESYSTPVPRPLPSSPPAFPHPMSLPPEIVHSSFYPQYIQTSLAPPLQVPSQPQTYQPHMPAPLGDWPHPNAPIRAKRKKPILVLSVANMGASTTDNPTPLRSRPSGPRQRSDGEFRPPIT